MITTLMQAKAGTCYGSHLNRRVGDAKRLTNKQTPLTYLVKSLKIPHNILQPHHEAARKVSSICVEIFPCSRITLIGRFGRKFHNPFLLNLCRFYGP